MPAQPKAPQKAKGKDRADPSLDRSTQPQPRPSAKAPANNDDDRNSPLPDQSTAADDTRGDEATDQPDEHELGDEEDDAPPPLPDEEEPPLPDEDEPEPPNEDGIEQVTDAASGAHPWQASKSDQRSQLMKHALSPLSQYSLGANSCRLLLLEL